jgi:hypothetical protein
MIKRFSQFINESKEEFDLKEFKDKTGGKIENIKYKDTDKIIDKSPLSDKDKKANKRGKKITYKESQDFDKKLITTTKDKIKIYSVDGTFVRDNFDIDLTMGGHAYIYPNYIPEDEVWIDKDMNDKDKYATIVHELTERNDMKNKNLTYNDAHDIASDAEIKARKK